MTENWNSKLESISQEESALFSILLLSAAFTVYMGPYNYQLRQKILRDWLHYLWEQGMPCAIVKSFEGQNTYDENGNNMIKTNNYIDFSFNYDDHIISLCQITCGEEICKHWLTLNLRLHDIENLIIMKSIIKRALLVVDPQSTLCNKLIDHVKEPKQEVIYLSISNRYLYFFLFPTSGWIIRKGNI